MQTFIWPMYQNRQRKKGGHLGAFRPVWGRKWMSFLMFLSLEPTFPFFYLEADRQGVPRSGIEVSFV